MNDNRKYTDPNAAGCLLEADACGKVVKELRRLAEKYQRKIDREQAVRNAEFEAVMEYTSEDEILEAYGWDFITRQQCDRYLEIFRNGKAVLEHHPPTTAERAHKILLRILSELDSEQREWAFAALSPAEQYAEMKRAEQRRQEWKKHLEQIKVELGHAAAMDTSGGEEVQPCTTFDCREAE